MTGMMRVPVIHLFSVFLPLWTAQALTNSRFETSCRHLQAVVIENGTVLASDVVAPGVFTDPKGFHYGHLPTFCRWRAVLRPSADSNIQMEMWLPTMENWNHKLVGTGHGGFGGNISFADLAHMMRLGFAAANSDLGTAPSTVLDGKPLAGHPEKQIDYGFRATHEMTLVAKRIVHAFYEESQSHAYFAGCSTGGAQGLIEAQRFPDDYDGIVVGAPAWSRTKLIAKFLWDYEATHRTPHSLLSETQLRQVTDTVVRYCNVTSGGLTTDDFLTDPRKCHWHPQTLLCTGSHKFCLNSEALAALEALYAGPTRGGAQPSIYPGIELGSESNLSEVEFKYLDAKEPILDAPLYWIFGPRWDWHRFDFNGDMDRLDKNLADVINAQPLNSLRAFQRRGGKVLMYHGWSDALLSPRATIDYYEAASDSIRTSIRLFMLPGMGHCYGGAGPNVIGGFKGPEFQSDSDHDAILALDRWVTQSIEPQRLIATKYVDDDPNGAVVMTRPVCAYPHVSQYLGHGDPHRAENFKCH
jgi:feruloyl esterase